MTARPRGEGSASEHAQIARTLERFTAAYGPGALACEARGELPADAWKALAELGVLALATPDGAGGAAELAVATRALGAANFPGPLVATFIAAQLLDGEERAQLVAGELVATLGQPPLFPWAPFAHAFFALDDTGLRRAYPRGSVAPVAVLGGDPWGRVDVSVGEAFAPSEARAALAFGDVALAAYLSGAAETLVAAAAVHARTRTQFGRAIGDFQAVAHPLATTAVSLRAAATLAEAAASALDAAAAAGSRAGAGAPFGRALALAAAARRSAERAALAAAYAAPQVLGALGVTVEGGTFPLVRRIRQSASPARAERARTRDAVLHVLEEPS